VNGRIVVTGQISRRRAEKRADFLLDYTRDVTIAVVEAKMESEPAGTGMQQAKEYAEMLGLKFAYATNGHRSARCQDHRSAQPVRRCGCGSRAALSLAHRNTATADVRTTATPRRAAIC
jgi:type I site-specific restriction endonuclease